ncbi:hypothetical protein D1007_25755 [Hordeum vulgare]|nr:hypothetical protein D1007_25755 [Hordeum vulgare]
MVTASSLPCLVFRHSDDQHATTLYSVSDGARRRCEEMDEVLHGKRSWVTSRGWLLLWDPATLATFLWNPRAAASDVDKIELSPWASPPPSGTDCVLSGEPTDPTGCTVVVLDWYNSGSDETALWYCHIGGTPSLWASSYWALTADEFGVLEFSPEPALTTVMMKKAVEIVIPAGEEYAEAFAYSLDLDGEVHMVWIFTGARSGAIVEIAVYRVDLAGKSFIRVDSIGDRAILAGGMSYLFASWCPANEFGLLRNSVYWINPCDGRMYVYEVGSNTEEVREVGEGAQKQSQSPPFWIVPPQP